MPKRQFDKEFKQNAVNLVKQGLSITQVSADLGIGLSTLQRWVKEITVHGEQARLSIFEYTELFYNNQRRHSTLGYISPAEFERRFYQQQLCS